MILKEPNNFKIHRLRIIHLYEADCNLLLGSNITNSCNLRYAKENILAGQHDGISGHDATTLTLMEEIVNDISRCSWTPMASFDNNASSCYDQIIVSLASLIAESYGQNSLVVWINAKTTEGACYKLKTALGISSETYSYCTQKPLYGTGQGDGNSPMTWCFISSTIFHIHQKQAHSDIFHRPDNSITVHMLLTIPPDAPI